MRAVGEEVAAAAGALAAVVAGAVLFLIAMMPFVFPFAFAAAFVLARRIDRGRAAPCAHADQAPARVERASRICPA